jgi:phosphatase NudJ
MNTDQHPHGDSQFKPNATVAAVIVCNDKFLLVEEIENNKHVLNQPAGHLELGENLIDAAKREILEETGLTLTPEYLSGIYYFYREDLDLYFMRFCFVIETNEYLSGTPQDDEIIRTHWLTLDEIKCKSQQLRSPMVLDCINDYLINKKNNQKTPLSLLKSNI